jgi:hypothetical protein
VHQALPDGLAVTGTTAILISGLVIVLLDARRRAASAVALSGA